MDNLKNVFPRMDLKRIRHYILYGTDDVSLDPQSYADILEKGSEPIRERLFRLSKDRDDTYEGMVDLDYALNAHESVYMELGMKAGARLMCQLLTDEQFTGDHPPMDFSPLAPQQE